MIDSLARLHAAANAARLLDPAKSRTARLLSQGIVKIAKKVGEEAVEVALEAVQGERDGIVQESADLLYHLTVLWAACGIRPAEVEAEMTRRERILGIAEKLPKGAAALGRPRQKRVAASLLIRGG